MESPAEDARRARNLLARAEKILASVDNSYIIKERGITPRPMACFKHSELELGRSLGKGGFGVVCEITEIALDIEENHEGEEEDEDEGEHPGEVHTSLAHDLGEDGHYEIETARKLMQKRCRRKGVTRYALKRLHDDLTELERVRGMIDLAVEAKFLSVVWHPNIVKMRGVAAGDYMDDGFFIIMDRLFGTLDQRRKHWRRELNQGATCCGLRQNASVASGILKERMVVLYDLAKAFMYLHENKLVYRDIKPENIGFDIRGDVKVFDFGLCKDLVPSLKAKDGEYGYRMTGRAGSLPYMAPEVALCRTYDTKCDVYSFSILAWEVLALEASFTDVNQATFIDKVVLNNQRPPVNKTWPPLTRLMLPEAWDKNPASRPDMKRIAIMIRGDLNDLTTDDRIRNRTKHLDDRSTHSLNNSIEEN